MAKANMKVKTVEPLVIGLADPGLTPLLRAGLGGLASSIRAHAIATKQTWPGTVQIGSGSITVEPRAVRIDWGGRPPAETLTALFEASFRITNGVIDLPGTYDAVSPPSAAIAAALQNGLTRTFLQHGKSRKKAGALATMTVEVDSKPATFTVQPFSSFAHQEAAKYIEQALLKGSVVLAGWAYPGATEWHIALKATRLSYSAKEALCACFALVGCLSFQMPRVSGGAFIVPEPTDLVRFARTRPSLTTRRLEDTCVSGSSDAALSVHLLLRIDEVASAYGGVGAVHGVQMKALPWATQQKCRYEVVTTQSFSESEIDIYHTAISSLPNKIRLKKADGSLFTSTSTLRGFITTNLAARRRWFHDFATARDGSKDSRFVHYYRKQDNLGALLYEERKGLIMMLNHLEDAEIALVRAVHMALRRRFGTIAKETKDNPATRKKRWEGERDRWRLAFAGSKTLEQIRAALADLWSRAGYNSELQNQWEQILPLLRPAHWKATRDLALIALASYRSEGTKNGAEADVEDDVDDADDLED